MCERKASVNGNKINKYIVLLLIFDKTWHSYFDKTGPLEKCYFVRYLYIVVLVVINKCLSVYLCAFPWFLPAG